MEIIEKEQYLKQIGQNLKEIRITKRKEIKEVVSKLKISAQAYGKIESGKTDLNISRLIDIANFFKVALNDIIKTESGDIMTFSSTNNSGGYHVQKIGTLNITDENLVDYFNKEIISLKTKIESLSGILHK